MEADEVRTGKGAPSVQLFAEARDRELEGSLRIAETQNPLPTRTLGDTGLAIQVDGADDFPPVMAVHRAGREAVAGLDASTVRWFRVTDDGSDFEAVWTSGFNAAFSYAWGRITRPGTYVAIGLPRDRLLQAVVKALSAPRTGAATKRGVDAYGAELVSSLVEVPDEAMQEIRALLAKWEIQTGTRWVGPEELDFRQGGHLAGFALPHGGDLKERLRSLEVGPNGLPENVLFTPPSGWTGGETPWIRSSHSGHWKGHDWGRGPDLGILDHVEIDRLIELLPFLLSTDWWMYHHDPQHTGRASGTSDISTSTVSGLDEIAKVPLDGPIVTIPSIVAGKVYVGTAKYTAGGGTLYKIDLASGEIEGRFEAPGNAYYPIEGIGSSPAIVGDRVYFTAVHGTVYCVEASTMTASPPHPAALWTTDLTTPNEAQNQPIRNPSGDSWSSPLVVNGKVYVGSGEGEVPSAYGFVWCLDAATGRVLWVFCTSKFSDPDAAGNDNSPNVIPSSAAVSDPLPGWATAAGYSVVPDPQETGCSVWSSCAYDRTLNRIYVGTGNSQYVPYPPLSSKLPDQRYGSGLLSLDADTGEFRGFFQPAPDDSYWPNDADVDVPCSPTVFRRQGVKVVGFGSKNGSYFLLDADTLEVLGDGAQRRQLLPREGGSGLPGDRGDPITTVVPTGGAEAENKWGVMATAAVHRGLGMIYVGLGGYDGIGDGTKTPFLRALDWETLEDAWPTSTDSSGVTRYTTTTPPMYLTNDAGLSSPAVVNDVVFVSTDKTALYALDAATGVCLWSAPGQPVGGWPYYALGPAISGNYVVHGAGTDLFIYSFAWRLPRVPEYREIVPWWRLLGPWPGPPDPEPWRRVVEQERFGPEDVGPKGRM
ncbi:MAG TPA: PQQ-binding-like beta-propeller repeat protein [Actinomycetota bacterium]|nr:PQQ-binding-like beta-propeller repeat protein [Actinomycetota bacterium]